MSFGSKGESSEFEPGEVESSKDAIETGSNSEREESVNDKDEDATVTEEQDGELEEALLLVKEMQW